MVKVGVIGLGFMGNMHSQCYKAISDAKLVAFADIQLNKAQDFAKKYGGQAYNSGDELINNPEIDVVDICLPTYLHKEYVLKAAKAKKHIMCEKPIALNVKDADEMIAACKKSKVKFTIGQVLRFWPEYMMLKEIFDTKKLGKLKSISCRRLSAFPVWSWEKWMCDYKKSGGGVTDLHIHDVDFLYYLLGRPKTLHSCGDLGHIRTTYTFKNGITALSEGGWDMTAKFPFTAEFVANFEKGNMEFSSRLDKSCTIYTENDVEYPKFEVMQAEDAGGNISVLGGYYNELKYFVDCIEQNKELKVVTAQDARNSLEIDMLEIKSAKTDKLIKCVAAK